MPIKVSKEIENEGAVLRALHGDVDEFFFAEAVRVSRGKTLVLDLSRVSRVDSVGVKLWTSALANGQFGRVFFVNVSPSLVAQFNMIVGFGSGGSLLSFYGYFICAHCNAETRFLFDAQADRDVIASHDTPRRQCHTCGLDAELDELPAFFFEHSHSVSPTPLDAEGEELLKRDDSWIAWMPGMSYGEKLLATPTKLRGRISGNITRDFKGLGTVENSKGKSVTGLWLSQIQYFDESAITRWERFISKLIDNGPVRLFDCPVVFMRRALENPSVLGGAKIAGLKYPMRCKGCNATQLARISVDQNVCQRDQIAPCGACGKKRLAEAGPSGFLDEIADWIEENNDADIEMRTRIEKTTAQSPPGHGERKYLDVPAHGGIPNKAQADNSSSEKRFRVLTQKQETSLTVVYYAHLIGAGGFRRMQVVRTLRKEYATDSSLVSLFLEEARLVSAVDCENVVRTQDVGRSASSFFATEDFSHGKLIEEIIEEGGAIPALWAAEIVRQLARGLRVLHGMGIVHGSVSPQSSLVTFAGVAKLFDFSAAAHARSREAGDNRILGRLDYLSPQLVQGGVPTPADDIWSLGILFLHLLTGRPVFEADTSEEIAALIARVKFTIPRSIPKPARKLIEVLTARDPKDRLESAEKAVELLDGIVAKLLPRKESIHRSRALLGGWLGELVSHQRAVEERFRTKAEATTFGEALVKAHPEEVGRLLRTLQVHSDEKHQLEARDDFEDDIF